MSEIYFISDIHAGAEFDANQAQRYKKLSTFFDSIKKPGNELFIVGDLFDFWFEYKHAIPRKTFFIMFEIAKLIEFGVRVHFLPGNHDCWFRNFFQQELKMEVHDEVHTPTFFGKNFYLFHGDGILKNDKGYRILKKIVRHPVNIFLYRLLHPDLGIPLAKFTSHGSREYTKNKFSPVWDEYYQFAQDKFASGFDFVIIGHTHNPIIKFFGEKAFLNLGDWITSFTYGKFSKEKGIELKKWEG